MKVKVLPKEYNIDKYDNDMKKLVSTLNTIIKSEEYTMLVESYDKDDTLEYGIIGQQMQEVRFDNLNGESFFEFMYKGIYNVAPHSVINFVNVNAFGNIHSSVIIDLNERVKAIMANRNHKYDSFILKLYDTLETIQDDFEKQNSKKGPILSKRMKPLS